MLFYIANINGKMDQAMERIAQGFARPVLEEIIDRALAPVAHCSIGQGVSARKLAIVNLIIGLLRDDPGDVPLDLQIRLAREDFKRVVTNAIQQYAENNIRICAARIIGWRCEFCEEDGQPSAKLSVDILWVYLNPPPCNVCRARAEDNNVAKNVNSQ